MPMRRTSRLPSPSTLALSTLLTLAAMAGPALAQGQGVGAAPPSFLGGWEKECGREWRPSGSAYWYCQAAKSFFLGQDAPLGYPLAFYLRPELGVWLGGGGDGGSGDLMLWQARGQLMVDSPLFSVAFDCGLSTLYSRDPVARCRLAVRF